MKLAPIIIATINAVIIIPFLVVLRLPNGWSTTLSSLSRWLLFWSNRLTNLCESHHYLAII